MCQSFEGEQAYLMEEERRRDLAFATSLHDKYPSDVEFSADDRAELNACLVRQMMRRDAGFR